MKNDTYADLVRKWGSPKELRRAIETWEGEPRELAIAAAHYIAMVDGEYGPTPDSKDLTKVLALAEGIANGTEPPDA